MIKLFHKLYILILFFYILPLISSGINNFHMIDIVTTQDIIAGDIFFEIIYPTELEYTYRLRPAKNFGIQFNSSFKAFEVKLVPTLPFDGCKEEFLNADDISGNVAFVERGECSFLTKTINVQKIGARAIIITETENVSSDYEYYIEMVHDNSARTADIPAGFLLGKNGRIIRNTLKKLRKKFAIINLPVNLTFTPPHQINHPPWLGL